MHLRGALLLLKILAMQLYIFRNPASAIYPDIREFMLDPPRTWTYNSTLDIQNTCKVDVALGQIRKDIYFNQSGIGFWGGFSSICIGHTAQSYDLSGRPWNLMFITDYLTGYTRKQIRFAIPGKCAVIKAERFVDTFPPNYELLVKDSALDGPPQECLTWYQKFLNESKIKITSKAVYNKNCFRNFTANGGNSSRSLRP
uniref:Lipocalin n=1 Tax=Rhipicephalus zambeziensis TaxID=60191 RepID=A0A224YBW3_9ACAR